MLRFDAVSLRYHDGPVLQGFDLAVARGEIVVLLGPSGCGKTSLLRLACGLVSAAGGRVLNTFRRTAVVFQEPRLLPWSSARDNVAFALLAQGMSRALACDRAAALLDRLGFSAADIDKRPDALSGGMQSRVAIARALVAAPDLVLMDEPFAALDVGLRRDLQNLVRETATATGLAALFVTHDVTEAVRLADRLVVLSARPARIVHDESVQPIAEPSEILRAAAALLDRPAVRAALLGAARKPPVSVRPREGGDPGATRQSNPGSPPAWG